MLETRNLCKIYKPKKGVPVRAIDDVSLKFPDTGMIFLLGKSGSGKSTLLNIMGGLDKADSGEIIIKDKSSKDFSQADFIKGTGKLHVVGVCELNYNKVKCIADIDLQTRTGVGHLEVLGE